MPPGSVALMERAHSLPAYRMVVAPRHGDTRPPALANTLAREAQGYWDNESRPLPRPENGSLSLRPPDGMRAGMTWRENGAACREQDANMRRHVEFWNGEKKWKNGIMSGASHHAMAGSRERVYGASHVVMARMGQGREGGRWW